MPTPILWKKLHKSGCAPDDPEMLRLWRKHGRDLQGLREEDIGARLGCSKRVGRTLRRVLNDLRLVEPPEDWPMGYAEPGRWNPRCDEAQRAYDARQRSLQPRGSDAGSDHPHGVQIEDVRAPDYDFDEGTDTYTLEVNGRRGGTHRVVLPGETVRAIRRDYSAMIGRGKTQAEIARAYELPRTLLPSILRKLSITHADDPFTDEELASQDPALLRHEAIHIERAKLGAQLERDRHRRMEQDAARWQRWEEHAEEVVRDALSVIAAGDVEIPRLSVCKAARPYAAVVGLSDYHYGDLSTSESRSPYDLDVAEYRLRNAWEQIGEELTQRGRPERIFYAMTGDIFTSDGDTHLTKRGTPQHLAASPREIKARGIPLLWSTVAAAAAIAPVTVIIEPGNHDRGTLATMAIGWQLLIEEAGLSPRVEVLWKPAARTYLQYGTTGMGFWHGDQVKPAKLPSIFAAEAPRVWGESRHRVAFHGHWHHLKAERHPGITVRQFRSLAGSSEWAEDNGHVGSDVGMDCYILDRERGIRAHLFADPEPRRLAA